MILTSHIQSLCHLTCWVIQHIFHLRSLVHYADDYFLVSSQEEGLASQEIRRLCQAFLEVSITLAEDKMVGPVKKVIYLCIEISVPANKYNELMLLLPKWLQKKKLSKTTTPFPHWEAIIYLQSSKAREDVPSETHRSVEKLSHHININKEAQLDIIWWWDFPPGLEQTISYTRIVNDYIQ